MRKMLSPQVKRFALDVWQAIGSPLSLRLARAAEGGEWDTIASCKVDPRAYSSAQEYFLDAIAASLLRKNKDLPTSFNRRANALANWKQGEVDCYRTNERLNPYLEGWTHPSFDPDVGQHIAAIREKIRVVLGRAPAMDDLVPRHGPGATFSDKSVRSTLADKMDNSASLTPNALWFLLDWVGTAWGREALKRSRDPVFVRGNRFSTAPKDAVKDRPIAAEPSINVFYQLALGGEVRRRLKKLGIDLDDGQEMHRQIARAASTTGLEATLDLSNASDTVAYNLVKLLLPPDWFRLFDELRSPFTRMSDRDVRALTGRKTERGSSWVRLEKFSSMGNGFTFELETLLFWAICDHAVEADLGDQRTKTLCYGDDIICDTRGVRAVLAALKFFGFTVNEEKSFVEGDFRESCGGDFWAGRAVRPYFLKGPLDEPQQLIAAANQIRRVAQDAFGHLGPLATVWHRLLHSLPVDVRRCRGPERLGDIVVHDLEEHFGWTSKLKDRIFVYAPVKHRKVSLRNFSDGTIFACGLYGVRVSEGFINPRDSVTGYAVRKLLIYGVDWLPTPVTRRWGSYSEPATLHPDPGKGPDYGRAVRVRK